MCSAHPWVVWHDIRAVDREGTVRARAYPFGESIPMVGSSVLTWKAGTVDGVVTVAPRGCAPALLAEAELRRAGGFPLLVVYNDGDPLDEARLTGFAWRLRSRPARRLAATATPSVETLIVTLVPGAASAPPLGFWLITSPAGTVSLGCWMTTAAKPPCSRAARAAFCVSPTTFGTALAPGLGEVCGPAETEIVTGVPPATVVPAAGVWSATWPAGTSFE